jgi:hypothetical protein
MVMQIFLITTVAGSGGNKDSGVVMHRGLRPFANLKLTVDTVYTSFSGLYSKRINPFPHGIEPGTKNVMFFLNRRVIYEYFLGAMGLLAVYFE